LAAIQNEGSERVVNNEKSTTRIITKKHMAQAQAFRLFHLLKSKNPYTHLIYRRIRVIFGECPEDFKL